MCRHQRDHSVSGKGEPGTVQPIGHPISHSTKSGFNRRGKVRVLAEDRTPASAVEGGNVVPDRSVTHGRVSHPRHERGRRTCFPLNPTHSAVSGFGKVESEFEAASPGT